MTAQSTLIITVIIAMPAIIAILLTIMGSIGLRSADLRWRFLLYSFSGSLLSAIIGCIIGAIVGGIVGSTVFLYRLDMRR